MIHNFNCEAFVRAKSLDDFGDVKIDFLDHIEKEFEDQLFHYIMLVDMAIFYFKFAFMFSRASGKLSNLISMASHFMYA